MTAFAQSPNLLQRLNMLNINRDLFLKKTFAFLFVSGAVLTYAPPSPAVEAGYQLTRPHWDSIVRISSSRGLCSGLVTSKQYILTAAHCVDEVGEAWSIEGLKQGSVFRVEGDVEYIDPEYDPDTYVADIAILKSSIPLDVPEFSLQSARSYLRMLQLVEAPSTNVFATGYGQDERGETGLRKGAIVTGTALFEHGKTIYGHWSPDDGGGTLPGDSGGPVFAFYEKTPIVIAVVSGGTIWEREIEGTSNKTESVERYAPIVPSLCRLDEQLAQKISFNQEYCPEVIGFLGQIQNPADSTRAKLWTAIHIHASTIEVAWIEEQKSQMLLESFLAGTDSTLFYEWALRFPESKFGTDSQFSNERLKALDEELKVRFPIYERELNDRGYFRSRLRQWFSDRRPSIDDRQMTLLGTYLDNKASAFDCGLVPCNSFLRAITGPLESHYQITWPEYLRSLGGQTSELAWPEFKRLLCEIDIDWITSSSPVPRLIAERYSNVFSIETSFTNQNKKRFAAALDSGGFGGELGAGRMMLGFTFRGDSIPRDLIMRYKRVFQNAGYRISSSAIGTRASGGPAGSFAFYNQDLKKFNLFAKDGDTGFSSSLSTYREFLECEF
jgi:hypothetical protein